MSNNSPEEIANEVFEDTPELGETSNDNASYQSDTSDTSTNTSNSNVSTEISENENLEEMEDTEKVIEKMNENKMSVTMENVVNSVNNVLEKVNSKLVSLNNYFKNKNKNKNQIVDGDIQSMAIYQDKLHENPEYQEYVKYIELYYKRGSKKNEYIRSYENNQLILTNVSNKSKRIVITPSTIVNLYEYKDFLDKNINNILYNIVYLIENYSMTNEEQKEEFQKLKNSYIALKKQHFDIETVEKNYYDKIASLQENIANIAIELNVLKEARIYTYSLIQTQITNDIKDSFMKLFKESNLKKPSIDVLNNISKELSIRAEDVEGWFDWIEKSFMYVSKQEEYVSLLKEMKNEEMKFEIIMKNFILTKPSISFS